ncbi:hypothetical protein JVT61DRAFT_1726 [Boletus reticuloceps]|uniref:Uncharacterized protein n=1 Tax=Boletus reticuloceps TaxID=495285 RepID=A0A8I2YR75_9AGAM|nr:hypothetical protein JVT61DRAFT_1726 [Boletus reticuloceps]
MARSSGYQLDLIDPRNAKTTAHKFMREENHLDALGVEELFIGDILQLPKQR